MQFLLPRAWSSHARIALLPVHHAQVFSTGSQVSTNTMSMRLRTLRTTNHVFAPAFRHMYTVPASPLSSLHRFRRSKPSFDSKRLKAAETRAFGSRNISPKPGKPMSAIRKAHTAPGLSETYEAIVVGAGPAGITALGNLLEQRIAPILWVDDAFDGGRINKMYREVPSNTKVKLFIDFATGTAPFRKIVSGLPSQSRWEEPGESNEFIEQDKDDRLYQLRQLDSEKGCQLGNAADMCLVLTEGLKKTAGVVTQQGKLVEAMFDENSSQPTWTVRIDTNPESSSSTTVQAKRLFLCTGAYPADPPLPVEIPGLTHIHLDTALSPTKLSASLSPLGPTTVAVVGASHSAILVLRNLADLALGSKSDLRIKWFTRHGLRYAEYEEGFIARDNTGLKGEAAVWARENLEPQTMPNSSVSQCITKISYEAGKEAEVYSQHMHDCSFVVQAVGFHRNAIPSVKLSSGHEITPVFDHDKGVFSYAKGADAGKDGVLARLPGLFGMGIAFPERVVDKKYGHQEFNVGFFKFMKAAKKWREEWR